MAFKLNRSFPCLDFTVVRLLNGLLLPSIAPRAKILLLAGDMGYGRSLKTLALSVRSILCVAGRSQNIVRTTERYFWTGTFNVSTSSRPPLPNRLTLVPVSNNAVSCWVRSRTSVNGRGASFLLYLTAATTFRLWVVVFGIDA